MIFIKKKSFKYLVPSWIPKLFPIIYDTPFYLIFSFQHNVLEKGEYVMNSWRQHTVRNPYNVVGKE